jgi:hypothetical protein
MNARKLTTVGLLATILLVALSGSTLASGANIVYDGAFSFGYSSCAWFTSDNDVFADDENEGCGPAIWDDNGWLMMDIDDEEVSQSPGCFYFEVDRGLGDDWNMCGYMRLKGTTNWETGCCVGLNTSSCTAAFGPPTEQTFDRIKIQAKNDAGGSPTTTHIFNNVVFSYDTRVIEDCVRP